MELEDRITYRRGKNHIVECSWCGGLNDFNESERALGKSIVCDRCGQGFSLDPKVARIENVHYRKWSGVLPCDAQEAHPNKVVGLPAEVWSDGYPRSLHDHRKPLACQVDGCDSKVQIPKGLPRGDLKDWDSK